MTRLLLAGAVLAAFAACKQPAPGAGGTIVLQIDSDQPVDRIDVTATDPSGDNDELSFNTKGYDPTKKPITGDITPGPKIKGGPVMFVGFGYTANGQSPI